jgi:hypothetical protein
VSPSTSSELPDKAPIKHIGEWDPERDAPTGWTFGACKVGMQVFTDGRESLFGGYTLDELRAIYEEHRS